MPEHSAVRSCQAGGSGEGEWRRVTLHKACSSTYWYTYIGMPIKLFLYQSQGERGSPSKFFGNTDLKKNFENYGRPLIKAAFLNKKIKKKKKSGDIVDGDGERKHTEKKKKRNNKGGKGSPKVGKKNF